MLDRRTFLSLAAASLAAPGLKPLPAWAESGPTRAVRLVVGFEPGGATDVISRVMAQRLSEMWGQKVTVENMPGAGGNLAAEAVAKSEPDGNTLFIVGPGQATNKFMYADLGYDPVKDFAPVTLLVQQPNVMAVPVTSRATSVKEFIALCKANPGGVTYASSGVGTTLHLCGELFQRLAGVEMRHVPFRGSAPALQEFLPGRVDVIFDNVTSILPHVMAGGARGLAVTTTKRVPAAPELPTLIQAGVPDFDVSSWFAMFAPAKTPSAVVARINKDAVAALAHDSVKPKLMQLGCEIIGSTPAELAVHLKSEMERWAPVIKEAGIKLAN
ncbi:tripartite tricarboxylate transporter substrate binding protein [Bradyrhizobium sp. LHD-71]|uniref:Bug family tripartite tricarboxylate transporter substrate binding protein n=1 Tax=Bradyrhizobium sp. LHD-71 TaxID=3072141 RepID=UPI00280FEA96|nr:tripartite tricarboxylate transporter substrate binding protein [Bradyrhizobium sp. LHD-71]MDQ8732461.1 tripartite tricarboxylate transporter substrate binding protein [Bradyrhizobium sp. LHD-71]